MKYCGKCGAELSDDAIYCPICGNKTHQLTDEEKNTFVKVVPASKSLAPYGRNVCALLGFIFSFISPLAGWILSGIGLKKAPDYHGDRKGLAIAGIVISSVNFLLGILLYLYILPYLQEQLEQLCALLLSIL